MEVVGASVEVSIVVVVSVVGVSVFVIQFGQGGQRHTLPLPGLLRIIGT